MAEKDEEVTTAEEALLIFQINRKTTDLAKTFFYIIEDLIDSGYVIPDDKYKQIRKRVLDSRGSVERELISLIKKLDISLKR